MSIRRFLSIADIVLRGHVFVPFWWSREKRRHRRYNVISSVVPKYLKRYLPAVSMVKETKIVKKDKKEKIFTIWLQGEDKAPALVKACYRSVRKHCKQELVVLDENTVFDYITLPKKIVEKYKAGKIKHAHFADICRVELLYEHGGYWLDSTGFVTSAIPDWIEEQDFFVFLAGNIFPYSFMQNCFIRAKKGSYLLAAWRAMILEYWMNENHILDYFMHQMMFKVLVENDDRAKKYFAKMPHVDQAPTHSIWWSCAEKPFDKELFNKLTANSFFQKTSYKQYKDIPKGSFADVMINKM